jgi:hypothetical protein
MKRVIAIILAGGALFGCMSVPPDVQAIRYTQALQSKDAVPMKEITLEGKRWTLSKIGIGLLEPDSRVAFVSLAVSRAQTGEWPMVSELHVRDGVWKIRQVDDCLLLEAQAGVAGIIKEAILTPDAYLSVDKKLVPVLTEIEALFSNQSSNRLPVIPIASHK